MVVLMSVFPVGVCLVYRQGSCSDLVYPIELR